MDKDRQVVCNIVSDMLENPDEHGIFPTTTAAIVPIADNQGAKEFINSHVG